MSALSSSSTVDLSRLPAPDVVEELSYEVIFAQMVARLRALLPGFDATVDSDPAVKVLQAAAYREMLLRQRVNDAARQNMVAFATGTNLEHLAASLDVAKLDDAETDDALRRRVVLAPNSFSVAGPVSAYEFHALSASQDVLDASVTSPAPCQVLVSILSRIGDGSASADLVASVDAALQPDTVRPLCDQVTVRSAEILPFAIQARLIVFVGPDVSVILAAARAKLATYLDANRKVGRDITLSGLYAALHVEGVQRVALDAPTADVVAGETQAAWCTLSSVTIAGNGE